MRRRRYQPASPGNAEKDTVEGQYDFIFAKDLVEHLEDDGPFFRRLARQLKPDHFTEALFARFGRPIESTPIWPTHRSPATSSAPIRANGRHCPR